jgi:hypothetical protein
MAAGGCLHCRLGVDADHTLETNECRFLISLSHKRIITSSSWQVASSGSLSSSLFSSLSWNNANALTITKLLRGLGADHEAAISREVMSLEKLIARCQFI